MRFPKHIQELFMLFLLKIITNSETLGQNLIINGDFSEPNVTGYYLHFSNDEAAGWKCLNLCEIKKCTHSFPYQQYCLFQQMDLSSDVPTHSDIIQEIDIKKQSCRLKIIYFEPVDYSNEKTIEIYFNNELVYEQTPIAYNGSVEPIFINQIINSKIGTNTLRLTQSGKNDSKGFSVTHVEVRQITIEEQLSQIAENSLSYIFETKKGSFPGQRQAISIITGYFINIDRMEFYYHHQRPYSRHSWLLISSVYEFQNYKQEFVEGYVEIICPSYNRKVEEITLALDFKKNYTDNRIIEKIGKSDGVVSNQSHFFFYDIPFIIALHAIFYLLFWLTNKWSISLLFRKYYFLLILVPLLFEGAIEQFTFYMTGQLLMFFSINFRHKLLNLFLLFFYFIVFVFGVFGFFIFKSFYRKKTYYLMDNHKIIVEGIHSACIDRGIFAFLFGATHRLLLFNPQVQLLVLGTFEVLWLAFRIYYMKKNVYSSPMKSRIMGFSGLIRIIFQITFWIYEKYESQQVFINNYIHLALLAAFIILWIFDILISLKEVLIFYRKIYSKCQCNNNQVLPMKQKMKSNNNGKIPQIIINKSSVIKKKKIIIQKKNEENSCQKEDIKKDIVRFNIPPVSFQYNKSTDNKRNQYTSAQKNLVKPSQYQQIRMEMVQINKEMDQKIEIQSIQEDVYPQKKFEKQEVFPEELKKKLYQNVQRRRQKNKHQTFL